MTAWLLVDVTVRVSLVLGAALALATLLGRRSAATRHWILAVGVLGALLVPVASTLLPAWHPPAWTPAPAPVARTAPDEATGAGVGVSTSIRLADDALPGGSRASSAGPTGAAAWLAAVPMIWAAGAAAGLLWLFAGVARLAVLARRARPVDEAVWRAALESLSERYGLTRAPRLVRTAHPTLLVAWGGPRATVILPASADGWTAERARVVLAHELAHIARADSMTLIAAEVLRALHWFNPLAWLAARRLRHESERACDDAVLDTGTDAHAYADHLVGVARDLRARPLGLPAPAMAASSSLERRIVAMMNPSLDRARPSRLSRALALLACLAFTVVVGAAQTAPATISGTVLDQTGGVVPGVQVVVTNAADEEVGSTRTNVRGHFSISGLAPGTYAFAAQLPGFKKYIRTGIDVGAGEVREHEVELEIGGLEETISIRQSADVTGAAAEVRQVSEDAADRLAEVQRIIDNCGSSTSSRVTVDPASGAVRVGGSIRAPRKIVHVTPAYSGDLAAQGIEGVVVLEGRINEAGTVEDVKILRDPHAALSQAAVNATSQWRFTPTLLNCEAVPVIMTVTMNFSIGD